MNSQVIFQPIKTSKQSQGQIQHKAKVASIMQKLYSLREELNTYLAEPQCDRLEIKVPEDAIKLIYPYIDRLDREEIWVIPLTAGNGVTGIFRIYQGTTVSSDLRIAELFWDAIRLNATAIILVHNHPSGEPDPSKEDIKTSLITKEAGKILGIELIDHIIYGTRTKWKSLKREKLI